MSVRVFCYHLFFDEKTKNALSSGIGFVLFWLSMDGLLSRSLAASVDVRRPLPFLAPSVPLPPPADDGSRCW
jgi:hypothetical protein